MNHEQLSAEAKGFYQQHEQTADRIKRVQRRHSGDGHRLRRAARDLSEASLDERHDAQVEHNEAETDYYRNRGLLRSHQEAYRNIIHVALEHYEANAGAYHEMAVQEGSVRDAGIDFGGDVATSVRKLK